MRRNHWLRSPRMEAVEEEEQTRECVRCIQDTCSQPAVPLQHHNRFLLDTLHSDASARAEHAKVSRLPSCASLQRSGGRARRYIDKPRHLGQVDLKTIANHHSQRVMHEK
jgi:hypothetical protein